MLTNVSVHANPRKYKPTKIKETTVYNVLLLMQMNYRKQL